MKREFGESLLVAFNQEMQERLTRARTLLLESDEIGSTCLDALHQEFDSLYGAARAVNCAVLERCFRTLAEYARWLRRRGQAAAAEQGLLLEGIERGLRCSDGGRCHERETAATGGFLQVIEERMGRARSSGASGADGAKR